MKFLTSCSGESADAPCLDLHFTFAREPVRLSTTPFGMTVDLPEGRMEGDPGGPALPVISFEAVLPPGTRVREVKVDAPETVLLSDDTLVVPLQPAAPGIRHCSHADRFGENGFPLPRLAPAMVPPKPELYHAAIIRGREAATITRADASGFQTVVTLLVRPLFLDEKGALRLRTSVRLSLVLTKEAAEETSAEKTPFSSRAQAERWVELIKSRVVNPTNVLDLSPIIKRLDLGADYLIITDNQTWDAEMMRPLGTPGGDLVAEFERLAAWKRRKGLSARVVTITDIMSGRHGEFAGPCRRDLQEVLREFVKFAHAHWGTAWLLLGGDAGIVPVRKVVGYTGGFDVGTIDPPATNTAFWTGGFLKIRGDVVLGTPLIRTDDGRSIPYDEKGMSNTSQPGWFYTDENYNGRSATPTDYVRVNGPAALANAKWFRFTEENNIPTDLYYGDVGGYPVRSAKGAFKLDGLGAAPRYVCSGHDWDLAGNGLYGQWNEERDIDGVHYEADISVGRAPVGDAGEARVFVDKVIAYESNSTWFRPSRWLQKVLFVSSNWGGRTDFSAAAKLMDGTYLKPGGGGHAVLQSATAPSSFAFRLISVVSETDQRELPYHANASTSVRGWHFARSATDAAPSQITIPMPWGTPITFPMPSRWMVAFGTPAEVAPARFILDAAEADASMLDQEELREQLAADVPAWSDVDRLYEDEIDLPPASAAAAPLDHLTGPRVFDRLNRGQHIVSLSGHGNYDGCCGLDFSMKTTLTNAAEPFIVYADSCLTNNFEEEDAISESLVQNPHGGAVAYIGCTRFSWIGVGDDFQRNFFKGLPATRAAGLLHDRRLAMVNSVTGFASVYNRWSVFALNLLGDPEMRLWIRRPRGICIDLPDHFREQFIVRAFLDERPAADVVVTVQQGEFIRHARTDREGRAEFELAEAKAGGELSVSVYHPAAALLQAKARVSHLAES